MKQKSDLTQFRTEIVIVFIFLGSIGFPGTYRQIFGGFIETLYEYLSFLMQIVIMLTSSGETVMDVKLLDMKPKYRAIYQFMIFTFAESMLVTDVPKAQVVTSLRLSVTILFAIWLVEHFTLTRILKLFSWPLSASSSCGPASRSSLAILIPTRSGACMRQKMHWRRSLPSALS